MFSPIRSVQSTDYVFEQSLENEEGRLFICVMLLKYTRGYLKKGWKTIRLGGIDKKSETIPIKNLVPKGWTYKQTYIYLYNLFLFSEYEVDVVFYKNDLLKYSKGEGYDYQNPLFDRFYNQNQTTLFFQDQYFCLMEDEIFEFVEIKNDFATQVFIDKLSEFIDLRLEEFVSGRISKAYYLLSHEKQRNIVLNKLSDFHSLVGGIFKVQEKQFKNQKLSLMFVIVLLWKLDYIYLVDFSSLDDTPEFDERGRYIGERENLYFDVLVTEKANKLFEGLFEMKNMILDKIFDEEYKKITILKKGGSLHMLEGEKEIDGDATRFVELQKKYPHSEIKAKNYKGKTMKYEVKEKIKLSQNEQE